MFRHLSIRNKVALVLWGTWVLVVGLATVAVVAYQLRTIEGRARDALIPIARLVSVGVKTAVAFGEKSRAQEVLDTLGAEPRISEAHLVMVDGQVLARYARDRRRASPTPAARPDGVYLTRDQAELVLSIEDQSADAKGAPPLARLHLAIEIDGLYPLIYQALWAFGAELLVLILVTLGQFAIMQRAVTRPISDLANIAETIRQEDDFSRRVPVSGTDEVARLGGHLNAMFDAIQERASQFKTLSQFHRAILDHAAPAIISTTPEGLITSFNPAAERLLGYPAREVVGQLTPRVFHDEAEIAARARASPILQEESAGGFQAVVVLSKQEQDWTYVRKDGAKLPVNLVITAMQSEVGQTTGFVGIATDITERQRAQEALRESEDKFRGLFETMAEGVALRELVRDPSGVPVDYRMLEVNPAYERMLGLTAAQVRGVLGSRVYNQTPPPLLAEFSEVARTGKPASFEAFFERIQRHFNISVISPKPGQIATVLEDITERKLKERDLQEKTDEMARFTYTVSHDLKSPLVTIKTFLGFLRQDLDKQNAERAAKDMTYIQNAADKMGRLLDELLELSRIGRKVNPPEEVSLETLVKEAVDLVAGRIANRGVTVALLGEPVLLYGDRSRLLEVFQNLVDNAVKFMGGQTAPRVEIGAERNGEDWVLFVRDNGMGIDPRHQQKLFGLFEKLQPGTEGTGIGLAVVRRIVEIHGGKIWAESNGLGQGVAFRFTLTKTKPLVHTNTSSIL